MSNLHTGHITLFIEHDCQIACDLLTFGCTGCWVTTFIFVNIDMSKCLHIVCLSPILVGLGLVEEEMDLLITWFWAK